MCVLELMNGHVLQTLREQLKVHGSRLEGSELLKLDKRDVGSRDLLNPQDSRNIMTHTNSFRSPMHPPSA